VRYLVQGTVQSRSNRVRLNVDLIETSQGRLVWTETFESSLDDLFLLQDELVSAVVSAIEPEIERAEYERASLLHPQNLDAWESYHMALWHSFRFTAEDTERANNFLQQALRQDARFARAHAAQSLVHFSRAFLHATEDFDREIELALTTAEHSISLDPRDAMGHWSLGRAQFLNQEHDLSLASLDRSLSANPNYAQGHYARGFVSVHAGIAAEALPELDTAQRLSPFDPLMFAMKSSRGISIALQGNYEEAALWAVRATLEPNAHYHIHAVAGACLELAGRHAEARRQIAICYSIFPNYSLQAFFRSFPYKDEGQRQLMAGALSRAGLR
jgi:tetratricopeptide (TPR) repeat protein